MLVLPLLALLLLGLTGGRSACAQATPSAPPVVANVPIWLTDLTLPKSVQVTWAAPNNLLSANYSWTRFTDASRTASAAGGFISSSTLSVTDAFEFAPGTSYYYGVIAQGAMVIPASGSTPERSLPETVDLGYITVIPQQPVPSDDQAVDSRLDPRYAVAHNLDHNFGKTVNGQYVATTYRGGLYAGFISDNSRVGRSFLKFPLAPLPGGQGLWADVGNLYLYYTRSYDAAATSVQAPLVAGTAWSAPTLTWDVAPALSSTAGAETNVVQTDPAHPVASWQRWHQYPALLGGLQGGSPVAFGLLSTSESSNGWAYFAKKEFNAAFAPCLLYGAGGYAVGNAAHLGLELNPQQGIFTRTEGGTGSANGVVFLDKLAPAGGVTITLTNSAASGGQVSAPSQVTIPAGQFCAAFTVSSSLVATGNPLQHGSYGFTLTASGPGITTGSQMYNVFY